MKEPSDSDLDYALKGAQLSNNSWGVLHTLGCIYAELGKTKEAREVLLQAMDSGKFAEPDPNFWYAFGRIAEQAGEDSSARADYARVTKPEDPVGLPTSSYRLAQMRLEVMQRSAK
jgi:predicted Zn-dependent protease